MGTVQGNGRHAGHFVSWDGGCLLIGRVAQPIPVHAHYAIQIAFGAAHGIAFRDTDSGAWTEYGVAFVPSRQPHAMDATRVAPSAVILIEPETREGRALTQRFGQGGITAVSDASLGTLRHALIDSWQRRRSHGALAAAAQSLVRELAGHVAPLAPPDERILRAAAFMRSHLAAPIRLTDVAAEACLSPSRFRHLFVEQTGMSLRNYVLWRRFLRVWELLAGGASLSAAAHAAGFADAAHLSRTSRTMFGFPPSVIQFAEPLSAGPDDEPARDAHALDAEVRPV